MVSQERSLTDFAARRFDVDALAPSRHVVRLTPDVPRPGGGNKRWWPCLSILSPIDIDDMIV